MTAPDSNAGDEPTIATIYARAKAGKQRAEQTRLQGKGGRAMRDKKNRGFGHDDSRIMGADYSN